ATGRSEEHVAAFRSYYQAQGLFGMPRGGECDYSQMLELDLKSVGPSVSGLRRPQDRIALTDVGRVFRELLVKAPAEGGYGNTPDSVSRRFPTQIGTDVLTPEKPLVGGGKQELETFVAGKKDTKPLHEMEMVHNRTRPNSGGDVWGQVVL